jgi:hypothetical protein
VCKQLLVVSQPTVCQGHSDSVQQTADIYIEVE